MPRDRQRASGPKIDLAQLTPRGAGKPGAFIRTGVMLVDLLCPKCRSRSGSALFF
jgi:hypothetical protein